MLRTCRSDSMRSCCIARCCLAVDWLLLLRAVTQGWGSWLLLLLLGLSPQDRLTTRAHHTTWHVHLSLRGRQQVTAAAAAELFARAATAAGGCGRGLCCCLRCEVCCHCCHELVCCGANKLPRQYPQNPAAATTSTEPTQQHMRNSVPMPTNVFRHKAASAVQVILMYYAAKHSAVVVSDSDTQPA